MREILKAAALGMCLCALSMGCGSGIAIAVLGPNITQVSPQTVTAGTHSVTLVVKGSNFEPHSVVLLNSGAMTTQVIDASTLSVSVTGSVLATPAVASVRVRNQNGAESSAVDINVQSAAQNPVPPLAMNAQTFSPGQVGTAYAATLTASGGTAGYTFSLLAGTLPTGLNLSPTGVISGIPTAAGSSSVTLQVADAGSPEQTATLGASIVISPAAIVFAIPSLPGGQAGKPYTATLAAGGGTPGYLYTLASGSLPPGLSLSPAGMISGTPTASGPSSFTVGVSDSGAPAQTATAAGSIAIAPSQLVAGSTSLGSGQVGKPYSATLNASGGTPGYTWSVASGTLPGGLSLSPAGVISGTPTAAGTSSFSIAVTDSGSPAQSVTTSAAITVNPSALTINSPALGSAQKGAVYTATLQASGGTPGYTWAVASGSLPAGLSLSPTGVISGTPTTVGNGSFTVSVTDSGSPAQTSTVAAAISVSASSLVIGAVALGAGQVGTAYSAALQSSGGTAGYTWTLASGSLPAGLSLSSAGLITGTPTSAGSSSFTVAVADSSSPVQMATAAAAITVGTSPLVISSTGLGTAQDGSLYSATLHARGGTPGYGWKLTSGGLPAGLSLSNAGVIAGTPTAAGTFNFTVMVSDGGSPAQTQSLALVLQVSAPTLKIAAFTLSSGKTGLAYSTSLSASGGTPAYTWSIQTGSLPAGLSLSSAGVISGTPTAAGTSSFTISVSDSGSPTQTQTTIASIAVSPSALSISTLSLVSGETGLGYSATVAASGGTPGYVWSMQSGNLPAGLTLAATTGVISGTPTTVGSSTFTLQLADSTSPSQTVTASLSIVISAAPQPPSSGTTWYVRPDGGTRYSTGMTSGQCDGMSDAPYSGTGVNQHCAFKDVRYLWSDGSYTYGHTFPGWGWIGQGGDTYIIRGSLNDGVSYRVGYNSPSSYCDSVQCWGITGDPYSSGAPTPPSGSAGQPTRILGGNYGSCHAAGAKTQLHGGYGVGVVLSMSGASYVDVECVDITDFSACGKSTQKVGCTNADGSLQDYASNGISWTNNSTHDALVDVHIHGLASAGMIGPTGDGVTMDYIDILGNPSSGWNADNGDGSTGTGSLAVTHFNISWNGCAEEYPIVDAVPYGDCTDQNSGGYGDGFGTATVPSVPGWQAHFDQGVVAYNTQDGLDALHLTGSGSSMTITRVLAYGNMGNQIKVGGASGTAINNLIVGNCNALRQPIPGTPTGYNTNLSDFCRAGNSAVLLTAGAATMLRFDDNTIYTAGVIGVTIECDGSTGPCDQTALVDYRNNIFVGFPNNLSNGDPYGDDRNPTPIYQCIVTSDCGGGNLNFNVFSNPGSYYSDNITMGARNNWSCPSGYESNALCGDPQLTDETWHEFGYGDMSPATPSSPAMLGGSVVSGVTIDFNGNTRATPPGIGAID